MSFQFTIRYEISDIGNHMSDNENQKNIYIILYYFNTGKYK